nr:glycoside hydrolase family 16 protein [Prevotella sp.]
MKHLNLLLFASSMMFVAPAYGQDYKKVWADEFDNVGSVDERTWNFETGNYNQGFGNWELENYSKANATVGLAPDGTTKALIITAKPDLTSARLFTKDKVSFKYGKLETRIMIPKTANGLWPAFWLLGNTGTWPSCGEIDVLEMGHVDGIKNGTQEKYYSGACHWGVYQNGGYPNYGKFTTSPTSLQDGKFHKFVLEWTPEVINMYLDDAAKPYYSMDISDRSLNTSPGNYFNKQFYLLVNLAIGGNFTGVHDRAAVTALNSGEKKMYVDYIRLYQKEGQECYTINGKTVDNMNEDTRFEDTTTELGKYGYKALDATGKSVFDFSKGSDYVIISASTGVMQQMGAEKIKADYSVDNTKQHLYIWNGNTYTPSAGTGVNSFGLNEEYTVYTVANVGWSGLGFAGVKDLSMLDDSYYLHFSVKGDDALLHASHAFGVGEARFTLGNAPLDGNMILGDFKRDGEWYSFDIPFSKLKKMAGTVFLDKDGGAAAYRENAFCALSGGNAGTKLIFDNVFFYKKQGGSETPDVDATLGEFGSKSLNAEKQSTFDIASGSDYVLIATGSTFANQLKDAGKVKADYNVDNSRYNFSLWEGTMTGATATGTNSFGYNEEYSCVKVVGGKGWSGAGYAPAEATDMSMIDDSYWLHFSMKTTNEISKSAPYAIVIGENAHFTIGSAPFVDGTNKYAVLGDFYRNGEWYSFDIPMTEIKKYGAPAFLGNSSYKNNILSVLAGGTDGVEVNLDGVFFYKKITTGIQASTADKQQQTKVLGIYDLTGRRVSDMNADGIYIVRTNKGSFKVKK